MTTVWEAPATARPRGWACVDVGAGAISTLITDETTVTVRGCAIVCDIE